MTVPSDFRAYVEKIKTRYSQTKLGWVETGKLLANPPRLLSDAEWAEIAVQLPGGKTELSKMTEIGKATWLHEPQILDHVPASKDLLYEIAMLGEDKSRQALQDGKITPTTQRHELREMRGMNPPVSIGKRTLPKGFVAAFKLRTEPTAHQRAEIVAKLAALAEDLELELLVEPSDDEKRAEKRWRELSAAQINGDKKRQGPNWKHDDASVIIGANDDHVRVQEIFTTVGIDFDVLSLVRQAYTEYGLSPPEWAKPKKISSRQNKRGEE